MNTTQSGRTSMNKVQQAQSLFLDGYLCSQSVLMTYASLFDLEPEKAARIAAPFGGGVARRGETCGAVNGAFMVLGLKYGHTSADDLDSKEKTYSGVEQFISQFQELNGSIRCNELLDCDISTPEGLQSAYDSQLFVTRCPKFVGDTMEILDQIMDADGENNEP
jgi:C_GCAxxG_C_C family probable redox protein